MDLFIAWGKKMGWTLLGVPKWSNGFSWILSGMWHVLLYETNIDTGNNINRWSQSISVVLPGRGLVALLKVAGLGFPTKNGSCHPGGDDCLLCRGTTQSMSSRFNQNNTTELRSPRRPWRRQNFHWKPVVDLDKFLGFEVRCWCRMSFVVSLFAIVQETWFLACRCRFS